MATEKVKRTDDFLSQITVPKPPDAAKPVEPVPPVDPAPVKPVEPAPPVDNPAPAPTIAETPAPVIPPVAADRVPLGETGEIPASNIPQTDQQPPQTDQPKKRGRPLGSKTTPPQFAVDLTDEDKKLLAVAGMTFDLSTGSLTMIFGDEWKPRNAEERQFVVTAIAGYYKERGEIDIPPKLMLAIACLAYCAPRFTAPNTSTKLKFMFAWLKEKIGGIFRRRKP